MSTNEQPPMMDEVTPEPKPTGKGGVVLAKLEVEPNRGRLYGNVIVTTNELRANHDDAWRRGLKLFGFDLS